MADRVNFRKTTALLLAFLLACDHAVLAQPVLSVPSAAARVPGTESFRPLHLRSVSFDPAAGSFRLHLDKGDAGEAEPPVEAARPLFSYFLVGIALPSDCFWVNLRPDAPDTVIDGRLARTDVGRIMLEADVILKKDLARFTSPSTPEGRKYWDELYRKAGELFGSETVDIPTLSRPWIVPDEVIVGEAGDSAYVHKATLKVMLEEDYLKGGGEYGGADPRARELNAYSGELIRSMILPRLTREVNSGRRYAALRQVYYSLILASWFKTRYKGAANDAARLIDRQDLRGLVSREPWQKETYFNEYRRSFTGGEYGIRERRNDGTIRHYSSGGISRLQPEFGDPAAGTVLAPAEGDGGKAGFLTAVEVAGTDAMTAEFTRAAAGTRAGPTAAADGGIAPETARAQVGGFQEHMGSAFEQERRGYGREPEIRSLRIHAADVAGLTDPDLSAVDSAVESAAFEYRPNMFCFAASSLVKRNLESELPADARTGVLLAKALNEKREDIRYPEGWKNLIIFTSHHYVAYFTRNGRHYAVDITTSGTGTRADVFVAGDMDSLRTLLSMNYGGKRWDLVDDNGQAIRENDEESREERGGQPGSAIARDGGVGGIDFRSLPVMVKAAVSLKARRASPEKLAALNIDRELRSLRRLVDSGMTPSPERISECFQAACLRQTRRISEVRACISDMMRNQENGCTGTDPLVKEIFVLSGSPYCAQQLREMFPGA